MHWIGGCASVFVAGFLYFISAIPAGAALGLPIWLAALCAWLGYSTGAVVVVFFISDQAQAWLMKKLRITPNPEKPTLITRTWARFGLPALGLLAPVTVGPQGGALLAMALGARKWPLVLALSLGALPATVIFATLVSLGFKLVK